MRDLKRRCARTLVIAMACIGLSASVLAAPAAAVVERLEISERSPVAGGQPFGLAGPYEKVAGRAHFALDPSAAANAGIIDLGLAPRDADGMVRFAADFYLLRPVENRGNGALLLEVPNRGGKAITAVLEPGAQFDVDPITAEALGDALLLRSGFTVAWIGWQFDVPDQPGLMRMDPLWVGPEEGPEAITGLVRADYVFSEDSHVMPLGNRGHRPYPPADLEDFKAVLTVRNTRLGVRQIIGRDHWRFARVEDGPDGEQVVPDATSVYLSDGFEKGRIYEIVYRARRPAVVGAGLAAVRDFTSFLKHGSVAGGEASPVTVDRALGIGISQSGRFLRHFLYQGFNQDEAGRAVFDGLFIDVAGAGRGSFNHRFAQPSRDSQRFSSFLYPTDLFPFTSRPELDPVTGREEGLLDRAVATGTAPKTFFTNSGNEYWNRAASLTHTNVDATEDVEPLASERIYLFASTQHFVDSFPPERAQTQYPTNAADYRWSLRSLLMRLDRWVATGAEPPPSRYPRLADGTLVHSTAYGFKRFLGVRIPHRGNKVWRLDFGPRFLTEGIIDREPPRHGADFRIMVPAVDEDGNELGGIRLPEIAVPVATYTSWNWRAPEIGAPGELMDFRGSFFPFARTRDERNPETDHRPSIAERYASREEYLGRYAESARALVAEGYLLAADLPALLDHAGELWELVTAAAEGESEPAGAAGGSQ
jgi:hypothetical protein